MSSTQPVSTYYTSPEVVHQVQIWYQEHNGEAFAAYEGGAWVAIDGLRCESLTWATQPSGGIPTAKFKYDYGEIDRYNPNTPGFRSYPPLGAPGSAIETSNPYPANEAVDNNSLGRREVRVLTLDKETGLPRVVWMGFIVSSDDNELKQQGNAVFDTVPARGTQKITAMGAEWAMDQMSKSSISSVANRSRNNKFPFNTMPLGRFAGRKTKNRERGRRLSFAGGDTRPSRLDEYWTRQQIVEYIVDAMWDWNRIRFDREYEHLPLAVTFESEMTDEPIYEWEGKTLLQCLNELISPRRFFSWRIDYEVADPRVVADLGEFRLRVFTTSAEPHPFGGAANHNPVELKTSGYVGARISLKEDNRERYDSVKVRGARRGIVLTEQVGREKGLLAPAWTEKDKEAYIDGPTLPEGLDDATKEFMRAAWRESEYPDVFTKFEFHEDFDWQYDLKDNPGYSGKAAAPQQIYKFRTERPWPLYTRWQRLLPLEEDVDYTKDPPVRKKRGPREYLKHFVFYRVTDFITVDTDESDVEERYVRHDQLADAIKRSEIKSGESLGKSVSIRPDDEFFGLHTTPRSVPAHWQAAKESIDDSGEVQPVFDWETDLFYTGYFPLDLYAEGIYHGQDGFIDGSQLVIDLGDVAFYDRMLPGTWVGTNDDLTLKVSPTDADAIKSRGMELRDDRDKLDQIAAFAGRYYCQQRNAYSISYSHIVENVHPGQIAVDVDGAAADTLVTFVSWDLVNNQTNIGTENTIPDITALAREVFEV